MWAITIFIDAIAWAKIAGLNYASHGDFTGAIATAVAYTLGSVLKNVAGVQD